MIRGSLNKRKGFEKVFETDLGPGVIKGLFEFRKQDGTTEMLFAHGGNLYRESDLTVLYSGLEDTFMDSFSLGTKMYFMNGKDFFSYDGTVCEAVTPYVPTLTISGLPVSGGGGTTRRFQPTRYRV